MRKVKSMIIKIEWTCTFISVDFLYEYTHSFANFIIISLQNRFFISLIRWKTSVIVDDYAYAFLFFS